MRRFPCTLPAATAALAVLLGGAPAGAAMREPIRALPTSQVALTLHLPLHNRRTLDTLIANLVDPHSPAYHHFLSPRQFAQSFGPTGRDRGVAVAELRRLGFRVDRVTVHDVEFHGPARLVEANFEAHVMQRQFGAGRVSTHPAARLAPTPALAAIGATLFHKSQIAIHRADSRIVSAPLAGTPQNRYGSTSQHFWFDDLKQAYSYPSYLDLNGRGRAIGVLVPGDFLDNDLSTYFGHEHLKAPTVVRRPVDGGSPFDPTGGSLEVSVDLQQSGGMAPDATLVHYNIPDLSDQSIYDGYAAIVDDDRVDVVNSSFGAPELYYTDAYAPIFGTSAAVLAAYHDLFLQGSCQGISFVASSGDDGAYPAIDLVDYFAGAGKLRYLKSVVTPASDPLVTAVGGTNLETVSRPDPGSPTGYSSDSAYLHENGYGDPLAPNDPFGLGVLSYGGIWGSGGGESIFFARPPYQNGFSSSAARAVPDVAGHMGGCPGGVDLDIDVDCTKPSPDRSADFAAFNFENVGGYYLVIGTSASAPDFAGLLALTDQRFGTRIGPANYLAYLYGATNAGYQVYRQNIPGYNGIRTKPGYDEVLGLGTVIGNRFALMPNSVAGLPRTPSNP